MEPRGPDVELGLRLSNKTLIFLIGCTVSLELCKTVCIVCIIKIFKLKDELNKFNKLNAMSHDQSKDIRTIKKRKK